MTAPAAGSCLAALDRLATALGREFATTLVLGTGRQPRLGVTCRRTRASGDVYADEGGWYRWGWAERTTATDDPLAAAHRVTAALRGHSPAGDQR